MKLRTVFFGSADISLPTLNEIQRAEWCDVVAVVTQPDRPVGRKGVVTPTVVKVLAEELSIPVFHHYNDLPDATYDIGVLVAYGTILPQHQLDRFNHGILNLHPSLLPRWRGPSPIQNAILHHDTITGVSIMLLEAGMDTGPVLAQQEIAIHSHTTADEIHDEAAVEGAILLSQSIPPYVSGDLVPVPQSSHNVTVTSKIARSDGQLLANETAIEWYAKYRAFSNWPGVFFKWQGRRYKVLKATLESHQFNIEEIQPSGKVAMSFQQFLNGHQDFSLKHIEQ